MPDKNEYPHSITSDGVTFPESWLVELQSKLARSGFCHQRDILLHFPLGLSGGITVEVGLNNDLGGSH